MKSMYQLRRRSHAGFAGPPKSHRSLIAPERPTMKDGFKLQNVLPEPTNYSRGSTPPTDAWFDPAFMQLYEAFRENLFLSEKVRSKRQRTVIPCRRGLMKIFGIALFALVLQAGAQQPQPGDNSRYRRQPPNRNTAFQGDGRCAGPDRNSPLYTTRSNADGRFFLPNVAPGTYRLAATRAGYVRTEYEQRFPGGPSLDSSSLRTAARRYPVVADRRRCRFRARHRQGQPVGIADVVAMKPVYNDGQTTMVPVLTDRTDDLGEYHLSGFRRAVITSSRSSGIRRVASRTTSVRRAATTALPSIRNAGRHEPC